MNKIAYLLIILPVIISCSKSIPEDALVTIGKETYTKAQFEAFEEINKLYPTDPGNFFPNFKSKTTHFVEAELIYNKTTGAFRDSLKKTDDWKLKQQYYPAQMFLMDFLSTNLGFKESEIADFYEANKESFKVTVTNDSTKKDSTYYQTLEQVKSQVVDSLFIKNNTPDSSFLARFDSLADQNYINEQYLMSIRQNLPNFFMKKIYKQVTGNAFPDSVSGIFGEGKYISPPELEVILNWISEDRRELYKAPERQRELVEWLVKWKLFSSYANDNQLLDANMLKETMVWAWKLNVVYAYVNSVMAPAAEASVKIDSAMLLYSLYDDNNYTPVKGYTDAAFVAKVASENKEQAQLNIDRAIMDLRKSVKISFLQSDWTDIKNQKPDSLFKYAETLRDSGKTSEAKDIFLTLTKEFATSPEGLNAYVELAKLQTEQQLYSQAISNYRKFLVNGGQADKRCNTFFMIGFIYDEYLDKPAHAEANYKWVLKNTPDCELADDAEFMMLHLNEPMSSVEELRDEATRQGRKIEDAEDSEVIK